MSKILILAEKPSVATDIAKAIGGCSSKTDGETKYYEGDRVIVSSAVGHLVELVVKEGDDPGRALHQLPLMPATFGLGAIAKARPRLMHIKRLMGRVDVDTIVNACDAGREGELIFRWIYHALGCKKDMKRMWLQSMTPDAIKIAYRDMLPGKAKESLYHAAQSRTESDFLVGVNGSRALSALHEMTYGEWEGQNVGRVMTPVLALITDLEARIQNFKPRTYWEVKATFGAKQGDYEGTWFDPNFSAGSDPDARNNRFLEVDRANNIASVCRGSVADSVVDESVPTLQAAPTLFDLTTLQREVNKKYGISAAVTLKIAQELYEKQKVLTYPRTDAKALPEDYVDTVKTTMAALTDARFKQFADRALTEGWVKPNKRIFDNSKISDHFAIVPTGVAPSGLGADEQKVYDLVVRRFLAAFYPAARFQKTTRVTSVNGESFKSSGSTLLDAGWMAVYGRDAEDDTDSDLVAVAAGECPPVKDIKVVELKTKAPERFTDATLLSAMELAGRLVDDEDLREAMAKGGLGTPATRAATIEKLHRKGVDFLVRDGKYHIPTQKAVSIIRLLRELGISELTEPDMTGEWELKLKLVEKGEFARDEFMEGIRAATRALIDKVRGHAKSVEPVSGASLTSPCPKCSGVVQTRARRFECACGLKVNREILSRTITDDEAEALFRDKKTEVLSGFISPKKKSAFAAMLVFSEDFSKLNFEFADNAEASDAKPVGACPKCQSNVVERNGNYFCVHNTRDDATCDFTLWGTIAGKQLSKGVIETLLAGGKTSEIAGFKSKAGKVFSAMLKMEGGKAQFEFKK